MKTNAQSGTNIQEIAAGTFRINTPVSLPGGAGFSFNQFLVVDDEPLLFHTGPRSMFPLVREAIESVVPVSRMRYFAFSHNENDECGSLNDFLAAAPQAVGVCGTINQMINADLSDRPLRALADGETLNLGHHTMRWFDAPHLPHGWECGYLLDVTQRTLFCGDLFTQSGKGELAVTESDILGNSETAAKQLDYWARAPNTRAMLQRFMDEKPTLLACMHGSAWRGEGAALLGALADSVAPR